MPDCPSYTRGVRTLAPAASPCFPFLERNLESTYPCLTLPYSLVVCCLSPQAPGPYKATMPLFYFCLHFPACLPARKSVIAEAFDALFYLSFSCPGLFLYYPALISLRFGLFLCFFTTSVTQRRTTNDQRPTTNDQHPTTNIRSCRGARVKVHSPTSNGFASLALNHFWIVRLPWIPSHLRPHLRPGISQP